MEIEIKNCNSIDETKIRIENEKLNIKYGANGTGKSTIVRAIQLATTSDDPDLSELTPFKYLKLDPEETFTPEISGVDNIETVSIFNEDYVNQFVFQQDELVSNSFEIFIKTEEYETKMKEIESLVSNIKETFKNDDRLDAVINDLNDLSNGFGKPTKSGDISAASPVSKAFGKDGNKVANVPESLKGYKPFLQSPENVKWIDWQIKGKGFLEISNDCPYCTSPTAEKKETILAVSKEYDKKSIEHLNGILKAIDGLGKYFREETKNKIEIIVNNPSGLSKEDGGYLVGVRNDIGMLKEKLSDLKNLSFFSFKDDEDIEARVKGLKIDLTSIPHMNSDESKNIVDSVNQSLDEVLQNIGQLKGQINQQKIQIHRTVEKHKEDINNFLKYAGYSYLVDIEEDGDIYKMTLKHKDHEVNISQSSKHLSYGERNAFALVLFMYECLSKKPDLIILDDPISSFDKNKKFAIIEMLFNKRESFKGKTVLMMTHDFEPIVDMLSTLKRKFHPSPKASFLKNREGVVTEVQIEADDILSFGQVCTQNVAAASSDVIKIIHLRRYFEIMDNKGSEYHILSSLIHKRPKPSIPQLDENRNLTHQDLTEEQIDAGVLNIKKSINNFDYDSLLAELQDDAGLIEVYNSTNNYYEKLQVYRILYDGDLHGNGVIEKFINETFHIENEYVMQLNPIKYDFIPEYIIAECDKKITT